MGRRRCLFILEVPVSYRSGWLEYLRANSVHDIHVLYLTPSQPDRPWETAPEGSEWIREATSLHLGGTSRGFFPRLTTGLGKQLDAIDPDFVILPGWAHPASWQAANWCRRRSVKYGVMFESWKTQAQTRVPTAISSRIRDIVLRSSSVAMPIGERAASFARSLGVEPISIVHGNTCDSDRLAGVAAEATSSERAVLFVGRLMPHKGSQLLLDMLGPLTAENVRFRIIGDGPDRHRFDTVASGNGLVDVLGPQPADEVAAEMRAADVVVVPSLEEPWGVVVHEALACGAPVVATTEVGSAEDLITSDDVGRVVEPTSKALVAACLDLLDNSETGTGSACQAAARSISYRTATDELDAAVSLGPKPAAGDIDVDSPIRTPRVVIDARTARTGGGATVMRVIEEMLVPSLVGLDVEVRRPPTSKTDLGNHPATPLTVRGRQPEVVLALSEAGNLGAGGSRRTIMMARNWNCWTPAETLRRRTRAAVARRNGGTADTVLVATSVFADGIRPALGPGAEVEVLPFGIGAHFTPEGEAADGSYFLCVGDWYPWKSFELAVEAFARIASDLPETELRIAGRPVHPDYRDATLDLARKLGVGDRVVGLGHLGADELARLYRGAIATVATSELESFGHPYLEALASGSPLIGRRMPVTEELVGDSAVLVDGHVETFARAMLDAAKNPSAERRQAGLNRAAAFSWDRYVARLRELIVDGIG